MQALWVHWGHRKCIYQARGGNLHPNLGPDLELEKRLVWNVIARADFHFAQVPLPKAKGKSPNVSPFYLRDGFALYFSSSVSSWKKSLQRSSISITCLLHSPCPPFLVTDWWPPRCLLNAPCDRGQQRCAHWIDFCHVPIYTGLMPVIFINWPPFSTPCPLPGPREITACWGNFSSLCLVPGGSCSFSYVFM